MDNSLPRETRLHKLRERRNLKLTEVAEAVGIAPSSLSAYENDENKDISLFALRTLAKYYNISADYLIGLSDNEEEILRSIREEQKTDKTTVDTTIAAEMEKAVQEAKNLHGTPKEKAIKVLCSRLGIQYDKFTDEEFAHFIKVFESAKNSNLLLKGNQRGKSVGSHSKRKGRGKNKRL